MPIFTSKIICSHCGKFFKRNIERGKYKWICPDCLLYEIDEDKMVEFISRRLYVQERTNENIQNLISSKVDKITVEDTDRFKVFIINDLPMYRNECHMHY